jgi:ribonuclease D
MPAIKTLVPPVWVSNTQQLKEMVDDLSAQPRLAVDTESNSLHAYREQVCLIQFSTPKLDYLLDPLVLTDLSLLAPIFSNQKIEKIFHAAEYDLICLRRDFGIAVNNLFDTMHAARILGYSAVGLDNLLSDKFGVKIDKHHQKANWAARPLTKEQIYYARLDTHYLFDLRDTLEMELRAKDRLQVAQEDFARACDPEEPKARSSADAIRRFNGRKDLSTRELTILNELCLWRETTAEKLNRPLYKVISDDELIAVARGTPAHKVDLAGIGLSERQIRLWGTELLSAVERGMHARLVEKKQAPHPDEAMLSRLEKLKRWRKKIAQEIKVESDIVLPRPYLFALAEKPPKNGRELGERMAGSPWRAAQYGSQILRVLGS